MLRDLTRNSPPPDGLDADVAVVGAGVAGLLLACKLAARGTSCVVLESGGREAVEDDPIYGDVDILRHTYVGATRGRRRGLGGTSVKWAGSLLPLRADDFAPRPDLGHPGWPIDSAALTPYLVEAERLFELNHSQYETPLKTVTSASDFVAREAKRPRFRNRNVAILCRKEIASRDGPEIWLHASVCGFELQEGRLRAINAQGPEGQKLEVRARETVLCAGAIESTRLLLLLDRQTGGRAIDGRAHLGLYLQDHLAMPVARIETEAPKALNAVFGFRFDGPTLRNLRFERTIPGTAGGYVHIRPRPLAPTGFDAVRDVMRGLQRRKFDGMAVTRIPRHLPYLAQLAWWRTVRKRLLWPKPAAYDVHVVVEQIPRADNRIILGERPDWLGNPVTAVDWDIGLLDVTLFKELCFDFSSFWDHSGFARYGRLVWSVPPADLNRDSLEAARDIYHPVGTTRMACSADTGVVNEELRVFGIDNLRVASTSVFPSAGSANPTMTLVLLTLRLADALACTIHRT